MGNPTNTLFNSKSVNVKLWMDISNTVFRVSSSSFLPHIHHSIKDNPWYIFGGLDAQGMDLTNFLGRFKSEPGSWGSRADESINPYNWRNPFLLLSIIFVYKFNYFRFNFKMSQAQQSNASLGHTAQQNQKVGIFILWSKLNTNLL